MNNIYVHVFLLAGECGELGRHAPPMKIKINGEMEYDSKSILEHHLTPGRMYIFDSSRTLSGTTGVGSNNDKVSEVRVLVCVYFLNIC